MILIGHKIDYFFYDITGRIDQCEKKLHDLNTTQNQYYTLFYKH
jgi:hypothetical protein